MMTPLRAILLAHNGAEEEQPLRETLTFAARTLSLEVTDPSTQRMLKRARTQAQNQGYLTMVRRSKHFYTACTAKGWAYLASDDEPEIKATAVELPDGPYRIGSGHTMPKAMWQALIADVRSGQVDILIVRPGAAPKIKFWDDQEEDAS